MITPAQKRRLEESAVRFLLRSLANWLFPAKTVGVPPIPGKVAKDGIMASTELRLTWKDRLRAVFCSRIQVVVMISTEKSPGDSVANINFNLLPPFISQKAQREIPDSTQTELPLKQNP